MKRSDFVRHTFVFILYAFSLNNPCLPRDLGAKSGNSDTVKHKKGRF